MKFMIRNSIMACFIVASVSNIFAGAAQSTSTPAMTETDFKAWVQGLEQRFDKTRQSIIQTLGAGKQTAQELEALLPSVQGLLDNLQKIINELHGVMEAKIVQKQTLTDAQIKKDAQPVYTGFIRDKAGLKDRYSVVFQTIGGRYQGALTANKAAFDALCKQLEAMKIDPTDESSVTVFENVLRTAIDKRNEYMAIVQLLQSVGESVPTDTTQARLNKLVTVYTTVNLLKTHATQLKALVATFGVQAANQALADIAEPLANAVKNKNINLTGVNKLVGQLNERQVIH